MARTYRRDRRGRFAPTPGTKVSATSGVRSAKARRRSVRRHGYVGAAIGAAVPAVGTATATGAALFSAASTATGYRVGAAVGRRRRKNRQPSGVRLTR